MSQSDAPAWRRGIVKEQDVPKCKVRVQLPDEDDLLTDWLPVIVPFALGAKAFWLPRLESQVYVLLDEHGEDGAVLGARYSQTDPVPEGMTAGMIYLELDDGTKITVDPDASLVKVDTPGDIYAKAGGNATLESPNILLKGAVKVEGTLEVTEDVTLDSDLSVSGRGTMGNATIASKDFITHRHTSASPGSPTSPPL